MSISKGIIYCAIYIISIVVLITSYGFTHREFKTPKILTLRFEHYIADKLLKLDSMSYINALNQSFTVSKFKYYISNITLEKYKGKSKTLPGYYLINEEDPESKVLQLKSIAIGNYDKISFVLGVDSAHNCSGAQSGALDPANGMFWTWNTGYVFLKLEGHCDLSNSPGKIFEYHIGGYKYPNNCIRKITLYLDKLQFMKESDKDTQLTIKTDIAELFKSPYAIDISKLSSVTDYHNAVMVADNYTDMFSLKK